MTIEQLRPTHWRLLVPRCYCQITPGQAITLYEKVAGSKLHVIGQVDGTFGLQTPCGGKQPRWIEAYMLQEQRAVIDWISEERGRLISTGAAHEMVTPERDFRSPWDTEIEKACAQVHGCNRATRMRARGKDGPSLQRMWFCYLQSAELIADEPPTEWRWNRVRRQIKQLGQAIANRRATTAAESLIKIDFALLSISVIADPNLFRASAALRGARAALRALLHPKSPTSQKEFRHAA
jgi:hypothetical protein